MGKLICMTLALMMMATGVFASTKPKTHLASEKEYQDVWCERMSGIVGVYAKDGTIIDCVTEEYVVEVDFARKFYEAIGQSLHYATQLDKKSAILLVVEKESDEVYLSRLRRVIEQFQLPITVFVIRPGEIPGLIQ